MVKLILWISIVFVFTAKAENSFGQKVSLNVKNKSLNHVFIQLRKNHNIDFLYSEKTLQNTKPISLQVTEIDLTELLSDMLHSQGLDFEYDEDMVVVKKRIVTKQKELEILTKDFEQQETLITGKVTDLSGNPLAGVSVEVKGQNATGTTTDTEGTYTLSVKDNTVLLFRYLGFVSQEAPVGGRKIINLVMEADQTGLEEVVVVGYGTMKKTDVTGAVASVNSAKLNTLPVSSPVEALQGKVAGVDIGSTTAPGESPSIRIRGNRSLKASNEPLYVVDGIPRNTIADIPVSDIESIEVLKDAASAAIYGSRGANGVVLVTTARGRKNTAPSVAYNMYAGLNHAKLRPMMNGEEYVRFRKDVFRATHNDGWASGEPKLQDVFAPKELEVVQSGDFVDWQDMLYRKNSFLQEHNARISQGREKSQVMMSLGYRNEDGYYKTSNAKRYSVALNIDQVLTDWAKVGISSRLTYSDRDLFWEPDINLMYMNPVSKAFNEDGGLIWTPSVQQTAAWNVLANYYEPYINNVASLKSFNVLYMELELLKGLKLRTNFGVDYSSQKNRRYYGTQTSLRYGRPDQASKEERAQTGILLDNILSYEKKIGKHSINATGVVSYQKQVNTVFTGTGEDFPGEGLLDWNLGAAKQNLSLTSNYEKWILNSYLGRFQYGYDDKYLLNFSMRADGSSVLAEGNKWGVFPAVSGAWVIKNEEFFTSSFFNDFRIRASYGEVGNSAISPYSTLAGTQQTTYNFGDDYQYGYKLGSVVNKDLTWEYSKTFNIGLETSFLNNRITTVVDVYKTKTTDLLMERSLPFFTGSNSVLQNVGNTSNTGVEIMLDTRNVVKDDFRWNTVFNFFYNKEKIDRLLSDEDMVGNNWFIGYPISVLYNYEKLGVWQIGEEEQAAVYNAKPGDLKLRDQNNDGKIDADNDRIVLGQSSPKFGLFLRNSFEYKNWTMSFAVEGKFGHHVSSGNIGSNVFLDGTRWLPAAIVNKYWTPDNPTNDYPYVNRAVEQYSSLLGIRKGSYLAMQEISLGYQFTQIKKLKGISVFAKSRNPFYIYRSTKDLDPQSPDYDRTAFSSFVMGLNVNF